MSRDSIESFVLDAGALIALEAASPVMTQLLANVRAGLARVIIPDMVLAQVWRGGGGRQARIATMVALPVDQCLRVPCDTRAAKRIGVEVGACGHADVVDVHVALTARSHGAAVITSDRKDILSVDRALTDSLVDI